MEHLAYQAVTFDICPVVIGQLLRVFKSLSSQIIVRMISWKQIINLLKEIYRNRLLPRLLIMIDF